MARRRQGAEADEQPNSTIALEGTAPEGQRPETSQPSEEEEGNSGGWWAGEPATPWVNRRTGQAPKGRDNPFDGDFTPRLHLISVSLKEIAAKIANRTPLICRTRASEAQSLSVRPRRVHSMEHQGLPYKYRAFDICRFIARSIRRQSRWPGRLCCAQAGSSDTRWTPRPRQR